MWPGGHLAVIFPEREEEAGGHKDLPLLSLHGLRPKHGLNIAPGDGDVGGARDQLDLSSRQASSVQAQLGDLVERGGLPQAVSTVEATRTVVKDYR